jgi:hypothetical protein
VHKVSESLQSIADRIWEMRTMLVVGRPTSFYQLVDAEGAAQVDRRGRLLITFLSLLELAKIGLVNVFQSENFQDIHVETKRDIDKDAISNVESYEAHTGDPGMSGDIWMTQEEDAADVDVAADLDTADERTPNPNLAFNFNATTDAIPEESATDEDIAAEELALALVNEDNDNGQEENNGTI